jgi:hypothetical protein
MKAANMRLRRKPPPDILTSNPIPENLESGIVRNWQLSSSNINTCVPPELWPYNEPDPKKWHIDIVHLLHEASTIDLNKQGKILCSNNDFFRSSMSHEIHLRQLRNRSASGKKSWMTATDLKRVVKHLHFMAEDEEDARAKGLEKSLEKKTNGNEEPSVRRGRSKTTTAATTKDEQAETNDNAASQQEKAKPSTRGRGPPKKSETNGEQEVRSGKKRQASDLPIRPARQLRGVKSPKSKPTMPPPVTPANPPESEDSNEEEEDQENEPPEPVSGRHIYGDFIKPTTIDFIAGADSEAAGQTKTRQTRKRGRADNEKPPTEEQIDSDPRDIDATGFLSELDPKEARRRRKPRLSRLQDDVVLEPAWSQDVPPPETPLLTPAIDRPISGTPAAPVQAIGSRSKGVNGGETTSLGIKMLLDLLPGIPDHATEEERSILEDRVALLYRDIVAYKTAVAGIDKRSKV